VVVGDGRYSSSLWSCFNIAFARESRTGERLFSFLSFLFFSSPPPQKKQRNQDEGQPLPLRPPSEVEAGLGQRIAWWPPQNLTG